MRSTQCGRAVRFALCSSIASTLLGSCLPIHVPELPAARPDALGAPILRADAVADIDTLMRVMEDVHPNLYALYPRDSAAADRARIIAGLPSTVSRIELWTRLAPFVARFGDGHTAAYMPSEEIARLQNAGAAQFPAQVAIDDAGHLVVTAVLGAAGGSAGVRRGDRLVSIDGRDADSLIRAWTLEFSGESERFRLDEVAQDFRVLALVHGLTFPYALDVVSADGAVRPVTVPGITQDSLRAILLRGRVGGSGSQAQAPFQALSYRALNPGVGYLNVRVFAGEPDVFAKRVTDLFALAAADSDSALIIDLRTNGGGDSRLADELLRHLTTAPYRMSARKDWKMSAEYRAHLKAFLSPPLRWLHAWNLLSEGRAAMRGPNGTVVSETVEAEAHPAAQPFFSGRVCVLIGAGTFSSAADLADAVKTYRLATLVGEETGGRVNSFGEGYDFRLPRSQLIVQVSSARFVRANGDTTDARGVVPDIAVAPTAGDRAAGRDAVLDAATARCSGPREPAAP